MILDTCAAGRLIEEAQQEREVPSNQTRALDRLKDRTGMYVLAGSRPMPSATRPRATGTAC